MQRSGTNGELVHQGPEGEQLGKRNWAKGLATQPTGLLESDAPAGLIPAILPTLSSTSPLTRWHLPTHSTKVDVVAECGGNPWCCRHTRRAVWGNGATGGARVFFRAGSVLSITVVNHSCQPAVNRCDLAR